MFTEKRSQSADFTLALTPASPGPLVDWLEFPADPVAAGRSARSAPGGAAVAARAPDVAGALEEARVPAVGREPGRVTGSAPAHATPSSLAISEIFRPLSRMPSIVFLSAIVRLPPFFWTCLAHLPPRPGSGEMPHRRDRRFRGWGGGEFRLRDGRRCRQSFDGKARQRFRTDVFHPLMPRKQRAPGAQRLPAHPPGTRCIYPSDKRPYSQVSIRRCRERLGLRRSVALLRIAPNRDEGVPSPLSRNGLISAASQIHPPRKPLRPGRETPSQSERPSWRRYSGYGSEPSPRSRRAARRSPRPTPALPEA